MIIEIEIVILNKTWNLVNLSSDKKAISLEWIFKIKYDAKDVLEKYKTRIIIRRFVQIVDLDFEEIFVLVVRIESIRIIFVITTINDLHILHVDCKNIFLHDKSDIDIYIT